MTLLGNLISKKLKKMLCNFIPGNHQQTYVHLEDNSVGLFGLA